MFSRSITNVKKVESVCLSVVPDSVTPWTTAHQTLLFMGFSGFSGQEYWSNGLPCPSPGDLLDPGIKPMSPELAGKFFTTETLGKHYSNCSLFIIETYKLRTAFICYPCFLGLVGEPS